MIRKEELIIIASLLLYSVQANIHRYLNNVSGNRQLHAPRAFRGGLIADHMGLGKSLSMIALIASDANEMGPRHPSLTEHAKTTLIIVPSTRKIPLPRVLYKTLIMYYSHKVLGGSALTVGSKDTQYLRIAPLTSVDISSQTPYDIASIMENTESKTCQMFRNMIL